MSEQARIDSLAFAQDCGVLTGVIAAQDLPRLCASIAGKDGEFRYRIDAGLENSGRAYLRLEAAGWLSLQCQRCLQVFEWQFAVESRVLIARYQSELEAWDRQADGLEDAILADHQFAWVDWLEDEVMLTLPVVPVHASNACPQLERQILATCRPNLFAGLAVLKQRNLKS